MDSEHDFDALLADPSKEIRGDVTWTRDSGSSRAVCFRVGVHTNPPCPLIAVGRFDPSAGKLTFALIHRRAGRIYGLDLGAAHRNPDGAILRGAHKHHWKPGWKDRIAYRPPDITAAWDDPVTVWKQFCAEANLRHTGVLERPYAPGRLPP